MYAFQNLAGQQAVRAIYPSSQHCTNENSTQTIQQTYRPVVREMAQCHHLLRSQLVHHKHGLPLIGFDPVQQLRI